MQQVYIPFYWLSAMNGICLSVIRYLKNCSPSQITCLAKARHHLPNIFSSHVMKMTLSFPRTGFLNFFSMFCPGLILHVIFIFRHAPLLIPWITVETDGIQVQN